MNFKTIPLFKSHYSIGRSILTLEELPSAKNKRKEYPISIFDILSKHKLNDLVLVDNSISGLLEANKNCKEYNINLIFGLIIIICNDINDKSDTSIKTESKYIIFLKNVNGYKDLIKINSKASTDGFYYYPRIDFKTLQSLWSENLRLSVPFYDSFLFMNTFKSNQCIPDFSFLGEKPTFFIEDNNLSFDDILKDKVQNYCKENKFNVLNSQSIYYYKPEDFESYMVFRCINNRTTMSCPNLDHLSSNEFNFEKWMELNK